MKNLKFILKCILALLPFIAVIAFTALVPHGYMDIEYPSWEYSKNVCDGKVSDISDGDCVTLVLGDSRAMADILPSQVKDETVVNLAVGGATSIEMYYTLNNYIKHNGNPEKVIIMFAPFHYTIIDNFWTRSAYFNYLSATDIKDLYSYASAAESETLMKKGYQNDLLSYRLRFPDKYLPALLNAKLTGRYSENNAKYIEIASSKGYGEFGTADGCSDLNYETGYEHMHTTGDAVLIDMYINRLLALCSDAGIETELSIPPMNESSYRALIPSYVDEFTDYLNTLKIKYPKITVNTEIPHMDDSYFGDASHLNHKGAIRFTGEFFY